MQTFLPYSSFEASVRTLDRQRLGKQRVETFQIMQTLLHCQLQAKDLQGRDIPQDEWRITYNKARGWGNHPAVKMWAGYEFWLLLYQQATVTEWEARGYSDTCLAKTVAVYHYNYHPMNVGPPPWLGREDLHISHQSNLVRKDPEYYRPWFPDVPDDLPYIYPTKEKQ